MVDPNRTAAEILAELTPGSFDEVDVRPPEEGIQEVRVKARSVQMAKRCEALGFERLADPTADRLKPADHLSYVYRARAAPDSA